MHYGRIGDAYDELCRYVAHILRTEMARNPAVAMAVMARSLHQSFDANADHGTTDNTLQFAKFLLQSVIKPPGTAREVVHSTFIIHQDGIAYMLSKFAGYQRINSQAACASTLEYFGVLSNLLASMNASEATQLLQSITDTLASNRIQVNSKGRMWEPFNQYTSKLNKLAGQEEAASSADEEMEDPVYVSVIVTPTKRSRGRPRSSSITEPTIPAKRKPGRPPGSKNVKKGRV
jgi:hypothetical protein